MFVVLIYVFGGHPDALRKPRGCLPGGLQFSWSSHRGSARMAILFFFYRAAFSARNLLTPSSCSVCLFVFSLAVFLI